MHNTHQHKYTKAEKTRFIFNCLQLKCELTFLIIRMARCKDCRLMSFYMKKIHDINVRHHDVDICIGSVNVRVTTKWLLYMHGHACIAHTRHIEQDPRRPSKPKPPLQHIFDFNVRQLIKYYCITTRILKCTPFRRSNPG